MIEFRNVKLNIRNIDILNDINFKIEKNTITCFLGNKNAGKTSILKILAGIYKKYSGEVYIDSVLLEENKARISMVFDQPEKDTGYTVYEYLKFYGSLTKKSEKEIDAYIDKMLRKYMLMSYKYTMMELLDNESSKFVQLIRAMISDPEILLIDNIFLNENPEYNQKIVDFLKTIDGKMTVIIASRTLRHIEYLCDNIGLLEAGNLLIFGDKNEVYEKTELGRKIEVELYDGLEEAIEILKKNEKVSGILYEDNKIIFAIDGDKEMENEILKTLITNGIKVYSYKKEVVTAEQLFGKLKDI